MKRNERGFTLMELMVVIVIVAILAAVAVPLYINYVRDAQRTEAKGAIGAIISAEEVAFQRSNGLAYLDNLPSALTIQATPPAGLGVGLTESSTNWTFAITSAPGGASDGFIVTATGVAGRPSAGLVVTYTHSRATPAANPWTEI